MEVGIEEHRVEESFSDHQLTTLTSSSAPTSLIEMTSFTPVSAALGSYATDMHHPHGHHAHYYQEFDWQQNSTTTNDPGHSFYTFAERHDVPAVSLYHNFSSVPQDLYSSTPALWHGGPSVVDDPAGAGGLPVQRMFQGVTIPRGSASVSSSPTSSTSGSAAVSKPKRRRVQSHSQRKAANVRERRRMFHLNSAFDELRKRLPAFNYEKRLSRIETLRLAMTYIAFMKDVMMGEDPRKVKLKTSLSCGNSSTDGSPDLSGVDLESCTSEDAPTDNVDN